MHRSVPLIKIIRNIARAAADSTVLDFDIVGLLAGAMYCDTPQKFNKAVLRIID